MTNDEVIAGLRAAFLEIDVFSGSASTGQAAHQLGRRYIGMDLRQSQCELGVRRMAEAAEVAGRPDGKAKGERKRRAEVMGTKLAARPAGGGLGGEVQRPLFQLEG